MKSFFTALFSLFLFTSVAQAAAVIEVPKGTYKVDPTHASLVWKVSHLGLSNYTARFTRYDATLTFDPAKVESSTLTVNVDPLSLETDYPNKDTKDFNKELQLGDNFFNANKFPKITFTSTKIEKTGDSTGKLTGDLTLLGVTKPLTLDFNFNGSMKEHPYSKSGALGFSATGVIKRSDWGMNYGLPYVGEEVHLLIEAEFLEQKADAKTETK